MTDILPQVLSIIYPSQYILSIYLSFHLSGAFHLCLHFHYTFTHSIFTFYRNHVLHFFKSQKPCLALSYFLKKTEIQRSTQLNKQFSLVPITTICESAVSSFVEQSFPSSGVVKQLSSSLLEPLFLVVNFEHTYPMFHIFLVSLLFT